MVHDLVFVSMENWDDVWRRNQFVCAEWARRHPDQKILFVGLPVDVSNGLRRRDLRDVFHVRTRELRGLPNVILTRPLKLLPSSSKVGRRLNEAMCRLHVRRMAKRLGLRRPILWLNPHYAVHMVGKMGESGVVYDITDDWTCITQPAKDAALVSRQDEELCRRADVTIVCSERLYQLKSDWARELRLIPNGVDADHYREVLDGIGPLPDATKAWQSPVFGYTGTIHPDRVDVTLLEDVARRINRGSLVLIGPNFLDAADRKRLEATGRVAFVEPVPYRDLPKYMRAFSACMTPHRMTDFTESLNPIKLWEYLAAGKPIVSTDVAGFRDYPQWVRIAVGPDEFAKALEAAVDEEDATSQRRREQARGHSWSSRVDAIDSVLADVAEASNERAATPTLHHRRLQVAQIEKLPQSE